MPDDLANLERSVKELLERLKVMANEIGGNFIADPKKVEVFAEASRRSRERFLNEQAARNQ